MFDWKGIGKGAGRVTLAALLSFVITLAIMLVMGVVLAAGTVYFLSDLGWIWATIGGVVAFVECLVLGVILASKRSIAMGGAKGVEQLRLGRMAVRLLFEHIIKIREHEPAGERGNVVVRTVERLPFAQAQGYAQQAVAGLLKAPSEGGGLSGWFRRLIRRRVIWAVETITLARFREEDAAHGGVDLTKVQADLEERIDRNIAGRLRTGVRFWTLIIMIGVPFQVIGMVALTLLILTAKRHG